MTLALSSFVIGLAFIMVVYFLLTLSIGLLNNRGTIKYKKDEYMEDDDTNAITLTNGRDKVVLVKTR